MLSCLARDYNDPDNAGMVHESAEGGYQGQVWDTHEFLQDELAIELPNDDDNKLFDAICDGLGSQLWYTRHSIPSARMRRWRIAGRPFASS
jgi:hypothetical protein